MVHRGKREGGTRVKAQPKKKTSTELMSIWGTFEGHCKVSRLSPKTVKFYHSAVVSLKDFIEESERSLDLSEFDAHDMRDYLTYLEENGLSDGGVHAICRALRAMWNWSVNEEHLESSPFEKVKLPKLPKRKMPVLQPGQFEQLLQACKMHPMYQLRNVAAISTLYDTGVRVSELVGLDMEDILWDEGKLNIIGKGNKQRFVPIGIKAMQSLYRYIHRERDPGVPLEPKVFINKYKEPWGVSGVQLELEQLGSLVGLERGLCSPHTFRRGFAVQFLRNGGNSFELQQILGHTTLEMTRRYVTYLDEDLKSSHTRNSPVDRLSGRR